MGLGGGDISMATDELNPQHPSEFLSPVTAWDGDTLMLAVGLSHSRSPFRPNG